MKTISRVVGLTLLAVLPAVQGDPAWWHDGDSPVIDPVAAAMPQGAANIGQAKHMVVAALHALDGTVPAMAWMVRAELAGTAGGMGGRIVDLEVPAEKTPAWLAQQQAPLLIGQLKALARPFYNHLNELAPDWVKAQIEMNHDGLATLGQHYWQVRGNPAYTEGGYYPWDPATLAAANHAVATIGQLKAVFSLRFEALDLDGDGLTDAEEVKLGTNPALVDSDGDTLWDLDEVMAGSDPLDPDADSDGLTDPVEIAAGTNPRNQDSDDDGIPDPIDSQAVVSAQAFPDADQDGIADGDDTEPANARGSSPSLRSENASGNPVSNCIAGDPVRFILAVSNPSGPTPTASDLTFFLNGAASNAEIVAIGDEPPSSRRFLLTWTATTTADYPARPLQYLTVRFRDAEHATCWLNLARIDVAEWEGVIAISPIRYSGADLFGMALTVESHVNGKHYADIYGTKVSAAERFYRGPRQVCALDTQSHETRALLPIPPGVKLPLFLTRFTEAGIIHDSTIDAGDYAAFPHNSVLYYNNSASRVRIDWGGVVTDLAAGSTAIQDYGTAGGAPHISAHWWKDDQMQLLCETSWGHARPFFCGVSRTVTSIYHIEDYRSPRINGFALYSQLPASITPHLAGTLEVPGLPIHPFGIELDHTPLFIASETYYQMLCKVDPVAGTWTNGIKLHLGRTDIANSPPQDGIGLYDLQSGIPVPVPLDANGDILLSPTDHSSLYQKLTDRNGLPLFLKRSPQADQAHYLAIRFVNKYEPGLEPGAASVKLVPVDLAVDANRDGQIAFDGEDVTTIEKPFRFWINNDQDDVEYDEPILVERPDCFDRETIKTKRDLEDFCRLQVRVGLSNQILREGDLQIGLSFRSSTEGRPRIRLWENQSSAGNLDYLTQDSAAIAQMAVTAFEQYPPDQLTLIPTSYWASREDSTANLIFEGTAKGKGVLVVTIHDKHGGKLAESAGIWIELLDVREMYQRARIRNEAEEIPDPWVNSDPPPQEWVWDPGSWSYAEDPYAEAITAIYVHGWRLKYWDFMNWSDTSYKRLWHQGFKGKFYAFRWPTFSGDNNGIPYGVDEELEEHSCRVIFPPGGTTYNASEYRAWLCGPALADFVNQLPGPFSQRKLFAHSMGNVVVGSALRAGMGINNYAMCNAAMAAMAYDSNPMLKRDPNNTANELGGIFDPFDLLHKTPDTSHNPAIRDGYGLENKFHFGDIPTVFSFGLPNDQALGSWSANNLYFKPNPHYMYNQYEAIPLAYQESPISPVRSITVLSEAMGYVTKSRTRAAGSDLRTAGGINDGYQDMSDWGPNASHSGFGSTHSAQWRWSNQSTSHFWKNLFEVLELKESGQ